MKSIEASLKKKGYYSDEALHKLGEKLPKKVRKKLRWKKLVPFLSLLLAALTHLAGALSNQNKSKSADTKVPTSEKHSVSAPPNPPPTASKQFSDDTLQAYVDRAKAYQFEIDNLAQNVSNGPNQSRVREMAAHVQAWTTSIIDLAHRIDNFRQNKLISRDLKEVPKSVIRLETRLNNETDPLMMAELERTLANRRQQLAALEKVRRDIQMAEIKIESTLSMLGTIYSQILAGQSTRQAADYRRLLDEIDEEVHTLQDHLQALEEVKMSRL